MPLLAAGLAWPTWGASLGLLLAYPALVWKVARSRRRRGDAPAVAGLYARFVVLSKFPQMLGQLKFWRNRAFGRRGRLIEYK